MTTLNDFGGGVEPPEPPYLKDVSERIPGSRFGAFGLDSNLKSATINVRYRNEGNRYEALDGYAFTEEALASHARRDVSVIYVIDVDEGDVFEYEYEQYFGEHGYEIDHIGAQRCVPVKYATVWEDHARSFIEESADITWDEVEART